MLEIAVDSLESAYNAIKGGADELEVCSYLSEGGLTPSVELVKEVQQMIKARNQPRNCRTKVNVTIRCRSENYIYNEQEIETMLLDIKRFKKLNVDSFVFGAISENLEIDERTSIKVIKTARPKKVIFSQAFDQTRELKRSAAILIKLEFAGVYTAGKSTTLDSDAIRRISYLAKKYSLTEFRIVAYGTTLDNVATYIDLECPKVHATCRKVKQIVEQRHFYLGIMRDTLLTAQVVDEDEVRGIKKRINDALTAKDNECEQI